MDILSDTVTVSIDDTLHLVCDFLKRNRILAEFVKESFYYHREMGHISGVVRPFGRDNAKSIITNNVKRYASMSTYMYGRSLRQLFISYDGSFDWSETEKGSEYWRKHLDKKWNKYLTDKYNCDSIRLD